MEKRVTFPPNFTKPHPSLFVDHFHMKDPLPWQTLHSEYVIRRKPYFTLRKDHIRMENGAEIPDYYIIEYPAWVSIVALTTEGDFLMIRQYRHGIGKVYFELAAGIVDDGEEPLAAAQRELLEETGYGGGEWSALMEVSPNPPSHTNTCYVFLAKNVVRLQNQDLESTEEITVQILSPTAMREALRNNEVFQAIHAAALWRFFAEKTFL